MHWPWDPVRKGESSMRGTGVIMLGPMPPLVGGMANVMDCLCGGELAQRYRVTAINNGKTTREGRLLRTGMAAQGRLIGRLIGGILAGRGRVVHIHTCSGVAFWRDCIHALVAKLLGSRVVWHVHGGMFDEFAHKLHPIPKALMRFALENASATIALSQGWVRRLKVLAPNANWYAIPNGVPVPNRIPFRNCRSVFLFLGNLGRMKGGLDLIEAGGLASRRGFTGRIDLGGKETAQGDRSLFEKRIGELDCSDVVRLIGVVSGDAKVQALSDAACIVLPSYAEGLPMAILEGMAYGLPVISTKVGAIPEVITDGVEGFLIEPGDVEALADRMVRLDTDSALRQRMGEAARARVMKRYSLHAMVDQITAVYNDVLKE